MNTLDKIWKTFVRRKRYPDKYSSGFFSGVNPLAKQRLPRCTPNAPSSPQDKFQATATSAEATKISSAKIHKAQRAQPDLQGPQKLEICYLRQRDSKKGDFMLTHHSGACCDWLKWVNLQVIHY